MTDSQANDVIALLQSIDSRLEHLTRFANIITVQKLGLPTIPPPEPKPSRTGPAGR
jgi:hypothetical protein